MSQITQALIDEFRAAEQAGKQAPYTANEFLQLIWAWEELQRVRAALTQAADAGAAEPVAYQIRRTDGKGIWEPCTREYYDDTLRTGRYAGWETGPAAEVRALVPAQQLQQAVARALEELKFHPQASHVEPNYRDWFNKTIDAAIRAKGTHD